MQSANNLVMSSRSVMMSKPVIAGTRITVKVVVDRLAAGETVDQIMYAYPRLTREGTEAALAFAAEALRTDIVYPADKAVR